MFVTKKLYEVSSSTQEKQQFPCCVRWWFTKIQHK